MFGNEKIFRDGDAPYFLIIITYSLSLGMGSVNNHVH